MSRSTYSKWELDQLKGPRERVNKLDHHERCLLYRRRVGHTQETVAEDMGISRYWVNQMEMGRADCTALLCHWEQ